jgi:hypothetical protein
MKYKKFQPLTITLVEVTEHVYMNQLDLLNDNILGYLKL